MINEHECIGTCFRFYTQMRVEKKTKHLHIEFIVTSHNSGGLTKLNSEYVHHMASPSLNLKPRDFGPIRLGIFFEKTIMICLKNQGFGKQNWGHHVLVYQYFVKIQKTPLLKALWCPKYLIDFLFFMTLMHLSSMTVNLFRPVVVNICSSCALQIT